MWTIAPLSLTRGTGLDGPAWTGAFSAVSRCRAAMSVLALGVLLSTLQVMGLKN